MNTSSMSCRAFAVCFTLEVFVSPFIRIFFTFLFAAPLLAKAATLEDAFSGFRKCQFQGFFYAPWDPKIKIHPYLSERGLKPYKEDKGVYFFKVRDTLFGLPVSEIIIPGTWDFHAVVFDVSLAKAQSVLKSRLGSAFAPSAKSDKGKAPALGTLIDYPGHSSLYCNEVEGEE